MTDPAQNESDVDALRKALKDSKGPGNFRNLFVYSPNGKKDGIQLIPVSEVAAKDEFSSIKNQTRDDVLASLRITGLDAETLDLGDIYEPLRGKSRERCIDGD